MGHVAYYGGLILSTTVRLALGQAAGSTSANSLDISYSILTAPLTRRFCHTRTICLLIPPKYCPPGRGGDGAVRHEIYIDGPDGGDVVAR